MIFLSVIGGTGELGDRFVLEVVKGTEFDTIKSLLAKYSDYDLTIISKEKTNTVESYILTFTRGGEKVRFEVHVAIMEKEMIKYLNSLID